MDQESTYIYNGRTEKKAGAGRRVLCVLLSLAALLSMICPSAAAVVIPDEASLTAGITKTYAEALAYDKRTANFAKGVSFSGYCAHYVNIQLMLLGINKTYVGGNGNTEFDNYRDLTRSGGGYRIHSYPASKYNLAGALREIAATCPVTTNILVGFESTGTYSGKKYGHAFVIRGIVDGWVYFSDSFGPTIDGVKRLEGEPIKCSIDSLCAYYRDSYFVLDGVIWFEDEALTKAQGGTSGQTEPENIGENTGTGSESTVPTQPGEMMPGTYAVTASAGLRIRAGVGTGTASLYVMPYNTRVSIRELVFVPGTDEVWGHVSSGGFDGWSSMSFAQRLMSSPDCAAVTDVFDSEGTLLSRVGYDDVTGALSEALDPSCAYTVTMNADAAPGSVITVPGKTVLLCGSHLSGSDNYRIVLSGGSVVADAPIPALEKSPDVVRTEKDGAITYSGAFSFGLTRMSLLIGNNVCLRFIAAATGFTAPASAFTEYRLTCTYADGTVVEYMGEETNGEAVFVTAGIPAKKLGDSVTAVARMIVADGDKVTEYVSDPVVYSPMDYVRSAYGIAGDKLDALLGAMMNYGAEAQKYFGYRTDSLCTAALPAGAVLPAKADAEIALNARALPHPIGGADEVNVTSISLELEDTVTMRLRASGWDGTDGLRMLVWDGDEFAALGAGTGAADAYTADGCSTFLYPDENGIFRLEGISAKQFADTYYFRLCRTEPNGTEHYGPVLTYSVTNYCAYYLFNGQNDAIDPLCRALARYSAAARDYFGYTVK